MQVPAHFEYERATSLEHAVALLTRYGPEARLVAGGHSLIPMMKLRLAQPEVLVDLNDLTTELAGVCIEGDELRIGALTRHAELLGSAVAGEHYPILHDAERVIADPAVRNRGTVGGSVCQADPSEDLSGVFAALRATAVIRGLDGERRVPMRRFFAGPYETEVGPAEVLVELRVPLRPGAGSAYAKVDRRSGDWAVAAVAAMVLLAPGTGGTPLVADVGIGLTAVGAADFIAAEAEEYLRGRPPDEQSFAAAGAIAARHCRPTADQRGPVDYKRHLVGELTVRTLRRAAERAGGGR